MPQIYQFYAKMSTLLCDVAAPSQPSIPIRNSNKNEIKRKVCQSDSTRKQVHSWNDLIISDFPIESPCLQFNNHFRALVDVDVDDRREINKHLYLPIAVNSSGSRIILMNRIASSFASGGDGTVYFGGGLLVNELQMNLLPRSQINP